jgi:hypothetical protein
MRRVILDQLARIIIHHNGERENEDVYRNEYCVEIAGYQQQERPSELVRQDKINRRRQNEKEDEMEGIK